MIYMLNAVNLLGRLTADPVLTYTHRNNIPVANFSIAVNRRFVKDREQETDFFNVTAWQGTAEFLCKNFTKGQPICVEGRLQQRSWDDNGKTRYAVDVIAESLHFAGFKREGSQAATAGVPSEADYGADFDPYANTPMPMAA
jgi:single-strand DNA-binding protein